MTTHALQLCPFIPMLETQLAARFEVHRYFEMSAPKDWLKTHGSSIRAAVTGGHIGLSNELMDQLPNLGVIAINGVGFDKVDLEHAKQRGVRVSFTPDVLTDDVADLAVGLIVSLLRGIVVGDRHIREGRWPQGELPLARKVSGRHFGILGLGKIGQAIAKRLTVFGSVAYTDLVQKDVPYHFCATPLELARTSDVLVLATAADASTKNLVNKSILEALGPTGFIVNVARGSLINEADLTAALTEGRIAGAALDVFADEPNVSTALRELHNVVLTPHIASASWETRENMARLVLGNLDAFETGAFMPSALV